jgi:hypothetical protein
VIEVSDYNDRRKPTERLCPRCLSHGRESVVMKQAWGDRWRLTCADYSICSWTEESNGPGDLDGRDGRNR